MRHKLSPCICGGRPRRHKSFGEGAKWIECPECRSEITAATAQDVITMWNAAMKAVRDENKMPTPTIPKEIPGDYCEISEAEDSVSGELVYAAGKFSISEPERLNQYINRLLAVHKRMKSGRKGGGK